MAEAAPIPPLQFDHFFAYDELTEYVRALANARADLCKLGSLGRSRQGREMHLLTLTDHSSGNPEDRPAYFIHGNIHAGEVAGTHAALYTARQLLLDHATSDLLHRVTFYIVPRINPDGAEEVVRTSGRVRSRTDRSSRKPNTLYQEDVNGDGRICTMRQEHPDGQYVVDPQDPRLHVRREAGSPAPYYRVYPEGRIHDWDGGDQIQVEGRSYDWNRNWSYGWRPEPEQRGSGEFPFSEPEMRLMAEFLHAHANLFGVLGYHTGPAAMLRPPSSGSLADLDREDDQVMEDLARIGAEETGFPVTPVIQYHDARRRDINLHGHFHDFGYHHLGLHVFEFELGIMANSAGISTEEMFGARTYQEHEALERRLYAWWDDQGRQGETLPLFQPWTPYDHPQLGRVEIGGELYPHYANPALPHLRQIAEGTYRFALAHANKHPWIVLEDLTVDPIGGPAYRVRARVANRGDFPTHVTNKGKSLRRLQPVRVEFHPADGVQLLSAQGHAELGHLRGPTGSHLVEWFVSCPADADDLCTIRVLGGTGGNTQRRIRRSQSQIGAAP
jgi:hypothetical protein